MAKTYANTFLYGKYDKYEQEMIDVIMTGERINKNNNDFEDIAYDVRRRQVSPALVKVLKSPVVVLVTGKKPLSKAFKVFCAKDIKNDKSLKVFIDCSGVITKDPKTGKTVCTTKNIDIFISYLVSAMHTYIYYAPTGEARLGNNNKIRSIGARAYAALFTHIVDYVAKISTIPGAINKCKYMAALHYLTNLLDCDPNSESVKRIARDVADISEREAEILAIQMPASSFQNIKLFVETVATVLHLNKLSLDVIIERWMYIYGTGTVFGLELFPAFASMITDAYVGCYVNNQKTIEKVIGTSMTEFTKTILAIGAESV